MLAPWKENHDKPRQCIKKQNHHFVDKGLYSQSYDFSSSPVWLWQFHHKKMLRTEELMLLNCGVGEDTWVPWTKRRSYQSILKEINPVYSLEGLMLKLQYFDSWYEELNHGKRLWCWERLRAREQWETKDEMLGWHHQLDGCEFEQTLGDSEEQASLGCCSPWDRRESDMTWWQNNHHSGGGFFPVKAP